MAEENLNGQPPEGGQPPSQENMIPLHRFNDLVAERNAFKQQAEKLQAQLESTLADFKQQVDELAPLKDQVAEKEQLLTAAQQRALRLEVAAEAGIPLHLADRLMGDNREAMMEDAKALTGYLKPSTPGNPPPAPRQPSAPAITEKQLNDPKWIRENKDKVREHYANQQQ